jgi:sterol desaturase/sphingolipid hydroxylase (fatty acid hydroxylase superfamily)
MSQYKNFTPKKDPASLRKCWLVFLMLTSGPLVFVHLFLEMHWFFALMSFFLGWYSWTFAEYMMHRFSFHNVNSKRYLRSNHFRHHTNPTEIFFKQYKKLLILALAFALSFFSKANPYFSFPAGFIMGLALYGYIHQWLHQPWAAYIFPSLQKFHMQHHCGTVHECFGVTCTWWDELFETCADEKSVGEKIRQFYFTKQESKKKNVSHYPVSAG